VDLHHDVQDSDVEGEEEDAVCGHDEGGYSGDVSNNSEAYGSDLPR
jgi:hypothetical protein